MSRTHERKRTRPPACETDHIITRRAKITTRRTKHAMRSPPPTAGRHQRSAHARHEWHCAAKLRLGTQGTVTRERSVFKAPVCDRTVDAARMHVRQYPWGAARAPLCVHTITPRGRTAGEMHHHTRPHHQHASAPLHRTTTTSVRTTAVAPNRSARGGRTPLSLHS